MKNRQPFRLSANMAENGDKIIYVLTEDAGAYGMEIYCEAQKKGISAHNITNNRATALRLIKLLASNCVYPDNVLDILDDIISLGV